MTCFIRFTSASIVVGRGLIFGYVVLRSIQLLFGCTATVDEEPSESTKTLVVDKRDKLNESQENPEMTSPSEAGSGDDSTVDSGVDSAVDSAVDSRVRSGHDLAVDSAIDSQASDSPISESSGDCQPPLLFGHRGTMKWAPENTLEAFKWARDNGTDGLELDVRTTRDAELVVIHDSTVKRTTDSSDNARVSELSFKELKDLDAGAWFDPDFAGARIPSLSEVFETFFDTALLYMLDVKEVELVPQLVELVEQAAMSDRVIFAASQLDILETLYVYAPQVSALYFLHQIDEVDTIALPNIQYLRVPKEIEHDITHGLRVAEHGFNVVAGASSMTWQTPTTALTVLAISNDVAKARVMREDRRPAHCTPQTDFILEQQSATYPDVVVPLVPLNFGIRAATNNSYVYIISSYINVFNQQADRISPIPHRTSMNKGAKKAARWLSFGALRLI